MNYVTFPLHLKGTETLLLNVSSVKKKTVNSNVLSSDLKLFRTKVDIKSVIRDYLLKNYVVNV